MKTLVIALMMLAACVASARQDSTQTKAQDVTFFDVLDLPARLDEPKLRKADGKYILRCALANRSNEQLVGLRLAVVLVNSANVRASRLTWNEAIEAPAYSINSFEFHPPIKEVPKDTRLFLAIEEVIGRDSVWRTLDVDKMLLAYARGQHSLNPKVQKLQNKYDLTPVPVIPARLLKKP